MNTEQTSGNIFTYNFFIIWNTLAGFRQSVKPRKPEKWTNLQKSQGRHGKVTKCYFEICWRLEKVGHYFNRLLNRLINSCILTHKWFLISVSYFEGELWSVADVNFIFFWDSYISQVLLGRNSLIALKI